MSLISGEVAGGSPVGGGEVGGMAAAAGSVVVGTFEAGGCGFAMRASRSWGDGGNSPPPIPPIPPDLSLAVEDGVVAMFRLDGRYQ